jgi:hypothetical protein
MEDKKQIAIVRRAETYVPEWHQYIERTTIGCPFIYYEEGSYQGDGYVFSWYNDDIVLSVIGNPNRMHFNLDDLPNGIKDRLNKLIEKGYIEIKG